jgi:biopolymer transport protein TolR
LFEQGEINMAMSASSDSEFNSEINVTPMVDIMLVLLIIFLVVTPLLQQGITVALPKELLNPEEDRNIIKEDSVVISVPKDDEYYINKDRITEEELGQKIKGMLEKKLESEKIVYLKSGIDVSYGNVVKVINIIRKQGIDKIGLVADKKKGAAAKTAS